MAYSLIGNIAAASTDQNAITTGSLNTTGADLIVVVCTIWTQFSTAALLTDSKGNTWTGHTTRNANNVQVRIWHCQAPTVGTGHTFTIPSWGGGAGRPSIAVLVFSGSTASPFDQESGDTGDNFPSSSDTTPTVVPTTDNQVVVVGIAVKLDNVSEPNPTAIGGGFTLTDHIIANAGLNVGIGAAYLVQTTAAAAAPVWTVSQTNQYSIATATFKSGGAAAALAKSSLVEQAVKTASLW